MKLWFNIQPLIIARTVSVCCNAFNSWAFNSSFTDRKQTFTGNSFSSVICKHLTEVQLWKSHSDPRVENLNMNSHSDHFQSRNIIKRSVKTCQTTSKSLPIYSQFVIQFIYCSNMAEHTTVTVLVCTQSLWILELNIALASCFLFILIIINISFLNTFSAC